MQRYGPPPSYPNLRVAGLNAPIPEGCVPLSFSPFSNSTSSSLFLPCRAAWGFHPGGWGKPPIDEYGRPLYGDIYGITTNGVEAQAGEPIDRETWGELLPEEEGAFSLLLFFLFHELG